MRSYRDQPLGTLAQLRDLRRNAPEPERRLLRALREAYPHLKWRHQSPVGPYRPDILCFGIKLILEVDGDTHAGSEACDAVRTRYLESEGYHVLRYANTDVMQNLDGVIASISLSLGERSGGLVLPPAEHEQRGALFTRHWARLPKARGKSEGDQCTTQKKGAPA